MRPLLLALCCLLLGAAAPAAAGDDFKVVVHADNPASEVGVAALSRLFLKKTLRWEDGTAVQPVVPASPRLQEHFALSVHEKSLNAVKSYWNQAIFSGRDVPPLEKASDAEVLAYVRANRGAVGYVSAVADPAGLKVLPVRR